MARLFMCFSGKANGPSLRLHVNLPQRGHGHGLQVSPSCDVGCGGEKDAPSFDHPPVPRWLDHPHREVMMGAEEMRRLLIVACVIGAAIWTVWIASQLKLRLPDVGREEWWTIFWASILPIALLVGMMTFGR
jgi:hypothetical protein